MEPFSVRMGLRRANVAVQTDDMDGRLRNGLWNAYLESFARGGQMDHSPVDYYHEFAPWAVALWTEFWGNARDALPRSAESALKAIRRRYQEELEWDGVYEFIEFLARVSQNVEFIQECNRILERERSGYRFADAQLVRVTDERDLEAIQRALDDTPTAGKLGPVHHHLEAAIQLFSDRDSPDFRNSIKESVSAVESLVNLINGGKQGTLGDAIKKLDPKLHPAFEEGVKKLYGWTSDAGGIRHALMDEPNIELEDAEFMLVLCSSFVSFLIAKATRAGVLTV